MLTTDRLILRPVTVRDHGTLLAHWTAPDVREFLFDGAILAAAEITAVITESLRTFEASGSGLWAVREAGGAILAGTVGLRPLENLGTEIFWSLDKHLRGRGLATEAARAVLDYAHGSLGLAGVLAEVHDGNAAAVAVIRRLGMVAFEAVPGPLGPVTRYRATRHRVPGPGSGVFTSGFPPKEAALPSSAGLRPLTQVMGACAFRSTYIGGRASAGTARVGVPYQMTAEAWNSARAVALRRLSANARACGADAVVGIRIQHKKKPFSDTSAGIIEWVATGTAVAWQDERPPQPELAMTVLSMQEYWKLSRQGYAVTGIVAWTSLVGCVPVSKTRHAQSFGRLAPAGRQNRELAEFSDAVRVAYRTAVTQMHAQAAAMGAEGVVGVRLSREQYLTDLLDTGPFTIDENRKHDFFEPWTGRYLTVMVNATGTAIVTDNAVRPGPRALSFMPVRRLDR